MRERGREGAKANAPFLMSQAKIGNETDGEAYRDFVVCAVAYIPKPHLMSSLRQYLLIPFGMIQCYRRGKLYKAVLNISS